MNEKWVKTKAQIQELDSLVKEAGGTEREYRES